MARGNRAILLLWFFIASCDVAGAAERYPYKAGETIELYLSAGEQNRIEFKGNTIAEVIGDENKYVLAADKQGGNIFIVPKLHSDAGFTISLITDTGLLQDLRITPAHISGRSIIIEPRQEAKEQAERQEIESMLKAMSRGVKGKYYVRSVNLKINANIPKGTEVVRQKVYRYGNFTGAVLLIRNKTRSDIKILEPELADIFTGTVAVSKEADFIAAQRTARVLIVTKETPDA